MIFIGFHHNIVYGILSFSIPVIEKSGLSRIQNLYLFKEQYQTLAGQGFL